MPKEPLPMRKIVSVLELHAQELSIRQIAASLNLKKSTVADYLARAARAGVSWPLPEEWDERDLHGALLAAGRASQQRPLPDFADMHMELRKKGMTLQLLHDEYLADHPDGYQYSQFCELYRRYRKRVNVSMRQVHRGGEKLFVDFAGQTVAIHDLGGGVRQVQLFLAVLGASNYTYAEAVASQGLGDWLSAHSNALEYFGGVAEQTVPDNLKAAVSTPCRYEPLINTSYEDWAGHYGTCILPARVGKPRDKAKAEVAVLVAERWILAALRKQQFYSLGELNKAIRELLEKLNTRPFKKLPGCRRSAFLELDKPALKPLRPDRYTFAEWRQAKVNIDYHISVHLGQRRYHYYSVPYRLVGEQVRVRMSRDTVEIYAHGKRVAAHRREDAPGRHSTQPEHMPDAHRRYAEWTPSRVLRWASETGRACRQVAQLIMADRPHPEQGFRSCLGLIALANRYAPERLEAACRRALALQLTTYRSIKNMLDTNQDKLPLPDDQQLLLVIDNPTHVRGSAYYK